MKTGHLNILIPQWQGGGQDLCTYYGGLEIRDNYLKDCLMPEVEVSTEDVSKAENDIIGYGEIIKQLSDASFQIAKNKPETIFTIGGGCDSDIVSMSYLNGMLDGNMTVLYLDAHGDLNTPEASSSKLFYGMSLRALLGDGDKKIIDIFPSKLLPSQIMMLGARDLDKEEADYIKKQNISVLSINKIEESIEGVIKSVKAKGNENIYVHIDLDVLDPSEFPYAPVPAQGGLTNSTFLKLLNALNEQFTIIGLGLLEFGTSESKENKIISEIVKIGCNL